MWAGQSSSHSNLLPPNLNYGSPQQILSLQFLYTRTAEKTPFPCIYFQPEITGYALNISKSFIRTSFNTVLTIDIPFSFFAMLSIISIKLAQDVVDRIDKTSLALSLLCFFVKKKIDYKKLNWSKKNAKMAWGKHFH